MPEPEARCGEGDGGEEVPGELVVARRDAPEVFQPVEEALDEIAEAVDGMSDRSLLLAIALGWDVRPRAVPGDQIEDGLGVVSAISDRVDGGLEALEQSRHGGLVGCLAGGQEEPDRQAIGINHGVDLGAQSSTRTANGVIRTPFFPPAACWWARTIEESIR